MEKINILAVVLAAVAISFMVVPAQAVPVNYDFQVTAINGPLAGTTADGTFAFDDSIIPVGGGSLNQNNLLTDLSFNWDGITYDETTANTGGLLFDATGNLTAFLFGNNCGPSGFGCEVVWGNEQWWAAGWTSTSVNGFVYSVTGADTYGIGTLDAQPASAVSEPSTIPLLGSGLIGLGYGRKKFLKK